MPLLYGEGERAFQRLQEEILRQSEDDSLFAHNGHDVLAKSPGWFEDCADVTRFDDAWPYCHNPALLNRSLSLNSTRITMTFAAAQCSEMHGDPWRGNGAGNGTLHWLCCMAKPFPAS